MLKNKFQKVYIYFEDGSIGEYIGKVSIKNGEVKNILDIKFSEEKPLTKDVGWEVIEPAVTQEIKPEIDPTKLPDDNNPTPTLPHSST